MFFNQTPINAFLLFGILFWTACQKDIPLTTNTRYPEQINTLINTRCTNEGCHNSKSAGAAGGLNLETWSALFEGGNGGAVVIPYRSDRSWLHYYTNTYEELGISLSPTMPIGDKPLTRDEVLLIKNWIDLGAPDYQGNIAFCCKPERAKYYVTNQGCDEVAVFDSESKLVMRYFNVGNQPGIESPHNLKVSPDGKYVYVLLRFGNVLQKFDAATDEHIADCFIDNADWNVVVFGQNGNIGIISDMTPMGKIRIIDLNSMSVVKTFQGLTNPHGLYYLDNTHTLYVTSQYGNTYYKISIDPSDFSVTDFSILSLQPGTAPNTIPNTLDPHEIIFSPDHSKYFITCQASNEVRVFKTSNDSLLAVITVGTYPLEMAVSSKLPYLAVTCEETPSTLPRTKGTVQIINYNTLQTIAILDKEMFQPHGIAIDDDRNLLIVASRNQTTDGPAPHHSSDCGGRNGFISFFDLNTFEPLSKLKTEVSVDPYTVTVRP